MEVIPPFIVFYLPFTGVGTFAGFCCAGAVILVLMLSTF